jgi:hypothetical protein
MSLEFAADDRDIYAELAPLLATVAELITANSETRAPARLTTRPMLLQADQKMNRGSQWRAR